MAHIRNDIQLRPCHKSNNDKLQTCSSEQGIIYLKLRKDGCKRKQALNYSTMNHCKFDSTKLLHGPEGYRSLRPSFENKYLYYGWLYNCVPHFKMGKNFHMGVSDAINVDEEEERQLIMLDQQVSDLKHDYNYYQHLQDDFQEYLNSKYSLNNLSCSQLKSKVSNINNEMKKNQFSKLKYVHYKKDYLELKLYELAGQIENESKKDTLIKKMSAFKNIISDQDQFYVTVKNDSQPQQDSKRQQQQHPLTQKMSYSFTPQVKPTFRQSGQLTQKNKTQKTPIPSLQYCTTKNYINMSQSDTQTNTNLQTMQTIGFLSNAEVKDTPSKQQQKTFNFSEAIKEQQQIDVKKIKKNYDILQKHQSMFNLIQSPLSCKLLQDKIKTRKKINKPHLQLLESLQDPEIQQQNHHPQKLQNKTSITTSQNPKINILDQSIENCQLSEKQQSHGSPQSKITFNQANQQDIQSYFQKQSRSNQQEFEDIFDDNTQQQTEQSRAFAKEEDMQSSSHLESIGSFSFAPKISQQTRKFQDKQIEKKQSQQINNEFQQKLKKLIMSNIKKINQLPQVQTAKRQCIDDKSLLQIVDKVEKYKKNYIYKVLNNSSVFKQDKNTTCSERILTQTSDVSVNSLICNFQKPFYRNNQ